MTLEQRIQKLAQSWDEEADLPSPREMSNSLLLKTCAAELLQLLQPHDTEPDIDKDMG